ncbi:MULTISPECIES: type II toxin-antitoxin system RelE/ParE family toxin [unclassified Moraxella]|uniref:type II toxin-antitoxin system RelE/ParE family toxin n=1 Tax=unclassified Moraxella TaxID=2685852 RepID=UPI003AF7A01D
MYTLKRTSEFNKWLKSLKNPIAKKSVLSRIHRLEVFGHFGDIDNVGDGILELRIHNHGGIRVYLMQKGDTIIVLLSGGDKSSQDDDIVKAKKIAKEYGVLDDEETN